jgi:hypothetical protein
MYTERQKQHMPVRKVAVPFMEAWFPDFDFDLIACERPNKEDVAGSRLTRLSLSSQHGHSCNPR